MPTNKDNKEAAINEARLMLVKTQIIISPKCKQLLFDLKNTTWNKQRTSYERSKKHGHGDAADALIYMIRNLHKSRNPYPADFDLNLTESSFISPTYRPSSSSFKDEINKVFLPKRLNKRIR
jgi:hypothetical protein